MLWKCEEVSRSCKECNRLLLGRIDNKFCSNECRTCYHNRIKYEARQRQPECITSIQNILLNNYRILTELRKRGEQFSTLYLQDLGFSFRYLTSMTETDGQKRCQCFDTSYVLTDQAMILLND